VKHSRKYEYTDAQLINLIKSKADFLERIPQESDFKAMKLYKVIKQRFVTWENALKIAGLSGPKKHKDIYRGKLTFESSLSMIKTWSKKYGGTPRSRDFDDDPELPSSRQINYATGMKWRDLIKLLKLPPRKSLKGKTNEEFLDMIRDHAKKLGRAPKVDDLKIKGLYSAVLRRFGSWRAALNEANIKEIVNPSIYTEEQLIEILRNQYHKTGKMPLIKDLKDVSGEVVANFGSWKNGLRKAGLPLPYSQEELLELIRKKADELDRIPLRNELPQIKTIIARFGRWTNALKQAGLCVEVDPEVKKEELLQNIRDKAKELGKIPRIKDVGNYNLYAKYFGSWKKALIMVGMKPYSDCQKYSDKFLLDIIRKKAKELGRTPTGKEVDYFATIYQRFGNFSTALKKAGFEPRR